MSHQLFANRASSSLAAPLTSVATSLTLISGGGAAFPVPTGTQYFLATLLDAATQTLTEIVLVTAVAGDSFTTITRAQEGTLAQNWLAGDFVQCLFTAGSAANLLQPDSMKAATNPIYPPLLSTGATQTASGIWTTTGVPSNTLGNNGDYAFRSDGGAGAHIYFKTGGAWTAIV